MLSILSAGCAFPKLSLSNAELGFTPNSSLPFFAKNRGVSIPLNYIKETGNVPIKNALTNSLCSPSDLGIEAVESALKKVGVTVESVGLFIGDSSTPWEVCPSEGQRVGGRLGRKVPSYDITASSCAMSAQLSTLLKWKEDRIPEYAVLLSANAVTQVVNYNEGNERFIFGDGASALLVSLKHEAGWKVLDANYSVNSLNQKFLISDLYSPLELGELPSADLIEGVLNSFVTRFANKLKKEVTLIASPLFEKNLLSWCKKTLSTTSFTLASIAEEHGDMLGATSGATFSHYEDGIKSGGQVLILEVGTGIGVGSVLLEKW